MRGPDDLQPLTVPSHGFSAGQTYRSPTTNGVSDRDDRLIGQRPLTECFDQPVWTRKQLVQACSGSRKPLEVWSHDLAPTSRQMFQQR